MDESAQEILKSDPDEVESAIETVQQLYDLYVAFPDSPDVNEDIVCPTKERTRRTSIRVTDEQENWADNIKRITENSSRELTYSLCVQFAREHQDKFRQFASELMFADVERTEQEDEKSNEQIPDESQEESAQEKENNDPEPENNPTVGKHDERIDEMLEEADRRAQEPDRW